MIDIKLIRKTPGKFRDGARAKNIDVDIDKLLEVDAQLLGVQQGMQEARTAQNAAGKRIAKLIGQEKVDAIFEMRQFKDRAKELGELAEQLQPTFDELLLKVPQPPADDVPIAPDESGNVVLRTEGEIRQFDFQPKDHVELGESLDIIDIPRGVKLAGSRNFVLKGAGCLLHQAVLRLAMDQMIAKGFTPLTVPVLVNEFAMTGTGYFPLSRDQAYLVERDEMSLVGTGEVPLTAYHADEIIDGAELPKKYTCVSMCFRREAGAAGKDTHGLYRIHYFDKVEQVIFCRNDDEVSLKLHAEILQNSEDVLEAMKLPYRVVNCCSGDLGIGNVQRYDIETWMPSLDSYGETHSASRYHDFQARRMNIRYRDADGELHFCHTLNNTVIASPRILIPLIELYQNADGTVTVPEVLRQYMGGMERITPKG